MEKVWAVVIDGGEAVSLPVPDGILVDSEPTSQLLSREATVDFDPVRVGAPAAHSSLARDNAPDGLHPYKGSSAQLEGLKATIGD